MRIFNFKFSIFIRNWKLEIRNSRASRGFSLIEVIITIAIFIILAGGLYFTYANVLEIIGKTRMRTLGSSLLNQEIEYLRNLPYDKVGIIGGYPSGVIPATTTIVYDRVSFLVSAYVRNIDDPFDGTTGGNPNDTAPADYRLVELIVSCPTCFNFAPLTYMTWAGPQNLETTSKNGSLFINVFNASGKPVSGADILVKNTALNPTITINDTTNVSGTLQLVDIPTSTIAYQITVTKPGYSSAKTYLPGDPLNPNPIQPHATIATQTVTAISFGIDKTSTLKAITQDYLCGGVGNVSINQGGAKLIGSGPDVFKYNQTWATDASGQRTQNDVEWDTYSFLGADSNYDLAGFDPLVPLTINPNTSTTLTFLTESKTSNSLLVTVTDASATPISAASVNLKKTGVDLTQKTGEKFLTQTDWSNNQYNSQDGNLEENNPAGELAFKMVGGSYPTSTNSWLISSTFDLGTATTTFGLLDWNPANQPDQTSLKFQLAANNDNATWNFSGPDGTPATYYTASSTSISVYNNNRYLRYKAFFNTTDENVTPRISDISLGFYSSCIPAGQAFFPGIAIGTYTVSVTKSSFQTATSSVSVGSGWQEARLILQ